MNITRRCLLAISPCRMYVDKVPYPGDLPIVPTKPDVSNVEEVPSDRVPEFPQKLISHLESLSLLRFDSEQSVAHLRSAVRKAMALEQVDTTGVEPMYTVFEDQQCPLREDIPEEPLDIKQVLANAKKVQDNYFVTPPGNVPLEEAAPLDLKLINQWDRLGKEVAPTPKTRKRDPEGGGDS
ncbi:aspartyl/glutamyl-tRNA(Asn/Gln) amidotransferase, C subunit [Oesophagostomum dentatum]|uniref:Glutamyl-tRNA(Gln) amidotransferase subunit C, mitochondrial n=1 Tax=Oesophagostomum dentatum TaxID=61180 RepID=A0A0B1SBD5_OESDE|nr:aspartyl/glutamyl-tRNA(Asn/Gln) amidotransferase, C subunit [Oesophagostomum dentatum]